MLCLGISLLTVPSLSHTEKSFPDRLFSHLYLLLLFYNSWSQAGQKRRAGWVQSKHSFEHLAANSNLMGGPCSLLAYWDKLHFWWASNVIPCPTSYKSGKIHIPKFNKLWVCKQWLKSSISLPFLSSAWPSLPKHSLSDSEGPVIWTLGWHFLMSVNNSNFCTYYFSF